MPIHIYVILFLAGLFAGIINTVGGGGSILTLPALMFAGLPGNVANATNRIGIILQNVMAIRQFRKGRAHEDHLSWRVVLIGLPGVILGARLAAIIPEEQFEVILGVLMPLLLIPILKKPKARLVDPGAPANAWLPLSRNQKAATLFTFLLLGVYAGFLQAGVGIMILAALGHLVRVDLVRGNYIKLVFVLGLNVVALLTFYASAVEIDWIAGLAVTAGQILGAYFGSWVAIEKGERWIVALLIVAIVLSSAKLLGALDWLWATGKSLLTA